MCVLLVEDEELIRMLLADIMIDAGYEVLAASDATTALDSADASKAPQLIVSDVDLGAGMDGFAFIQAARCRWPGVPVLMMSGAAANFADRRGEAADRFLRKPFSLDAFMHDVVALAS